MLKIKFLSLALIAIMFFSDIVLAQASGDKKEFVVEDSKKEKQIEKERMIGMAMNMLVMAQKQMVATADGGFVVLLGNKLLKYDKDLNLIKAVELSTSVESLQK